MALLLTACARAAGAPQPAPVPAVATATTAAAAAVRAPRQPPAQGPQPYRDTLSFDREQYPSTYRPRPSPPVLIRNATILTATGVEIERGSILLQDGRISAVGADLPAPAGAIVVDGTGKFVTPGLIDTHSHLGVHAAPGTAAEDNGNESTNPNTAQVWAEHSFWPQDPQLPLAQAGGVTTIQVLPGSANLIGGRSVTMHVVPGRTVQDMKFPGAPYGVKMACGENPKRVYGRRNSAPSTRMGNMAGYRSAFIAAERYRRRWDAWNRDRTGDPPERDLQLETLAGVLRGRILVQNHCYRADEMAQMMDLGREFGFHIRSFHHAVEAYKIADVLARENVASSVWADWWGFKMEAFDGVQQNAALITQAGARAVIHSDDERGIQRLNQEAAKAMWSGRRAGISITRDQALRWVTANPAWVIGLDSVIGTLEVGKNADVVVWNGDPFSVYARAELVYVDGALMYDRNDAATWWRTDFELGNVPAAGRDR
ncbi:MAG: amidohydrolase family protein [Gemmatimonadales bacterium]|nr:amidohydrolase family protein [Gemmatimonadales bacterium]